MSGGIGRVFSGAVRVFNDAGDAVKGFVKGKMGHRKTEAAPFAEGKRRSAELKPAIRKEWKVGNKRISITDRGVKIGSSKKPKYERKLSDLGVNDAPITNKKGLLHATSMRKERLDEYAQKSFNTMYEEMTSGGIERNARTAQKAIAADSYFLNATQKPQVAETLRFETYHDLSNSELLDIVKNKAEHDFCRMQAEDILLDRGVSQSEVEGSVYVPEIAQKPVEPSPEPQSVAFQKSVEPEELGSTTRGRIAEQREGIEFGDDEIQISQEQISTGEKRQSRMTDLARLVVLGNNMSRESIELQMSILDQKIAAVDEAFEKQPELKNDPAQQKLFQSLHKERSDLRKIPSARDELKAMMGTEVGRSDAVTVRNDLRLQAGHLAQQAYMGEGGEDVIDRLNQAVGQQIAIESTFKELGFGSML